MKMNGLHVWTFLVYKAYCILIDDNTCLIMKRMLFVAFCLSHRQVLILMNDGGR